MRPSAMGSDIEFLRDYLEEEFSSVQDARVQVVLPTGTKRSIDLHQDYDPEANDLHARRGVRVLIRSRDYFFPAEWARNQMKLVREQVAEMRDFIGSR